jgi:predicted peroxiredoxin
MRTLLAVVVTGAVLHAHAAAQPAVPAGHKERTKMLVHVTQGPEDPTRAALAFLVARTAIDEGDAVTLFLAGDAVQLMRDGVLDSLAGFGTGKLRESFDAIVKGGGRSISQACRARPAASPSTISRESQPSSRRRARCCASPESTIGCSPIESRETATGFGPRATRSCGAD